LNLPQVIEHIPDISSKEEFIEDISKLLNEVFFLIVTTFPKERGTGSMDKYMNLKINRSKIGLWKKDLEELIVQIILKHKIERFSPSWRAPEMVSIMAFFKELTNMSSKSVHNSPYSQSSAIILG
jgi:hypothetical protein